MTVPVVSPRAAARRRLFDLITAAATTSDDVAYGTLRNPDPRRAIVVGNITDNGTEVPVMKAGRKAYDDRFAITVHYGAFTHGDDDLGDIDAEANRLLEVVRGTVATYPTLNSLDGIVSAVVESATGPNPGWTDDGKVGVSDGEIVVAVHARVN